MAIVRATESPRFDLPVFIFSGCWLQAEDLQSCVPGVWKWTRSQALMVSLIN